MRLTDRPVLSAAALFCRCAGWFPLWLMLLVLSGNARPAVFAGLLGCVWSSAVLCRMFRLLWKYKRSRAAAASAAVMALFACICGFWLNAMAVSIPVCVLLIAVPMLMTHRRLDAAPDELFGSSAYVASLTMTVIVCAVLVLAHYSFPMECVMAAAGVLSAVYFLQRNQFMLLRLVNRRSNAEADVPKEIRRGNLMLLGGVALLLTLIFVFRGPLLHLLVWMQDAARWLAKNLLNCIIWVISRLGGDAPDPVKEKTTENMPEMLPESGKSSWLWLLLWIPALVVAGYVWHVFISDWVYNLRALFVRILHSLRHTDAEHLESLRAENAEYVDTETALHPKESRRKRIKSWKRALKKWQQMPENDEKFYAGYRLLLDAPCWAAGEIRAADTVRRIEEKWMQGHTPPEMLRAVTADFHADRYAGEGLPPEALGDIAAALKGVQKT